MIKLKQTGAFKARHVISCNGHVSWQFSEHYWNTYCTKIGLKNSPKLHELYSTLRMDVTLSAYFPLGRVEMFAIPTGRKMYVQSKNMWSKGCRGHAQFVSKERLNDVMYVHSGSGLQFIQWTLFICHIKGHNWMLLAHRP